VYNVNFWLWWRYYAIAQKHTETQNIVTMETSLFFFLLYFGVLRLRISSLIMLKFHRGKEKYPIFLF